VDYFTYLLSTYGRPNGVVLDTNVFLLYVVGTLDPVLLRKIKRTSAFDVNDFVLLTNLLSLVPKTLVTPGIVTETCNLLESDNKNYGFSIFPALRHLMRVLHEDYVRSDALAQHTLFARFGLADSSIAHLAGKGHLVITEDLDLQVALKQLGLPVINFTNLRTAEWIQ
jgi:rRNA-processing protein FCF1